MMKKGNDKYMTYLAPSFVMLDLMLEGIICDSPKDENTDSDHEDWFNGGNIG